MLLADWTEKVAKRGLDPLGIQNSGVQLYQQLLPGVSNVTLRIRYYGLYCWASEAYAQTIASTSLDAWRDWIRRLEALHALVAVQAGGETGVAGVEWAVRQLASSPAIVDFADGASMRDEADRYLSGSFGVFGQAYLSQMVELGLFTYATHHVVPTRSVRGLAAAKAFSASIGPATEAQLLACIRSAQVTREQLIALRPILPSRIGDGDERDLYEDLLFARVNPSGDADRSRRDTLLLILQSARAAARRPSSREIRRRLFCEPAAPELEPQRLRWEAYQAQDMWQVAAAALLRWAIAIIEEAEEGRSLPALQAEVAARIAESWPTRTTFDWEALCAEVDSADDAIDDRSRRLTTTSLSAEDRGRLGVEQMAALDRRVRDRPDLSSEIVRSFPLGGGGRSILSELRWLEERRRRPVLLVVPDLVVQRIVRRHTWVATQKLRRQRDYTFLLEARDGRLAYRAQYDPVATTPRLDPAIQFLADIGLLDAGGCTARGRQVADASS